MRALSWWIACAVGLVGVLAPVAYLYTASQLPKLESEFDLQRYLTGYVEGQRTVAGLARSSKPSIAKYTKPRLAEFPSDLTSLYLSGLGCPNFLQTPRESSWSAGWRAARAYLFGSPGSGNGRCEWILAAHLARAIDLAGGLRETVATQRIRSFLDKDQLVAFDLSSLYFEPGVLGVEEAARVALGKRLDAMQLQELAELTMTLPPYGFYLDIKQCKNPVVIRQNRDFLLRQLAAQGLVTEDRVKSAQARPLTCVQP